MPAKRYVFDAFSVTSFRRHVPPEKYGFDSFRVKPIMEKYEAALLILLGFGGFSVFIAVIYNVIRKYVFKDSHNLDTVFDAGGRVTLSLTAVTVTSQLLWPAAFLQSSTMLSTVSNKELLTLFNPF